MNHPPGIPTKNRLSAAKRNELAWTSSAQERHRLSAVAPSCGPQSLPIDPEYSELKAPRTSRDGQHTTFQTVPAATAPSFLPSWIPPAVCSVLPHSSRHADRWLALTSADLASRRQSASCRLSTSSLLFDRAIFVYEPQPSVGWYRCAMRGESSRQVSHSVSNHHTTPSTYMLICKCYPCLTRNNALLST